MATLEETVELLGAVPVFETLGADDLRRVAEVAVPRRFAAHQVIFREGDASDTCYVVRSGHARAVRENADGRTITLAHFGPGDIFGELAMFDDERRSATVETLDAVEAVGVAGSDMRRLLREHPDIAAKLVIALGRRLRAANERISRQSFQTVQSRVATVLGQLVAQAQAEGAEFRPEAATGLRIESGRLKAGRTTSGEIPADRAVICAGARSGALAAAAASPVPLETERGYHALVLDPEAGPRTPLMPSDGKMSITRTRQGLRCAGQVEIAGLEAAPNWRRAEILRDHLLRSFPKLPRDLPADRVKFWMGHRPSMPDGLPCIGPSRATPDVILAFGHGHVGLVAGPRTAGLVAAMLAGESSVPDPAPYNSSPYH